MVASRSRSRPRLTTDALELSKLFCQPPWGHVVVVKRPVVCVSAYGQMAAQLQLPRRVSRSLACRHFSIRGPRIAATTAGQIQNWPSGSPMVMLAAMVAWSPEDR